MQNTSGPSTGTLLFDGDCGFCTTAARRATRINPQATVVAWQHADLDLLGVTEADATAALQYVSQHGSASGADAVALFLLDAGGVYRFFGRLLRLPGVRSAARPAYRWIAAHRQRLPGGTPACAIKPATPSRD